MVGAATPYLCLLRLVNACAAYVNRPDKAVYLKEVDWHRPNVVIAARRPDSGQIGASLACYTLACYVLTCYMRTLGHACNDICEWICFAMFTIHYRSPLLPGKALRRRAWQ